MKGLSRWLRTWGYLLAVGMGAGSGLADGPNSHKRLVGLIAGMMVVMSCWTIRETWRWLVEVDTEEKKP